MGKRKLITMPYDSWLKVKILATLENTSVTQLLAALIDEHAEVYSKRFNVDIDSLVEKTKEATKGGKATLFDKVSRTSGGGKNA